jgi:formylglycine-generating enzyme required for sulfatase activity
MDYRRYIFALLGLGFALGSCGTSTPSSGGGPSGGAAGGAAVGGASGASGPSGAPDNCPTGMAALPGGRYTSVSSGAHVSVDGFCLDMKEVTVDAYKACATCMAPGPANGGAHRNCNYGVAGRGDHPINCVDWTEATTYCKQAGKRLPTDAEWEWAARDGDHGYPYPWGTEAPGDQLCWNRDPTPGSTCAVGTYPADTNRYGVSDLGGNVSEWTSSLYDPAGTMYVLCGAGWDSVPGNNIADLCGIAGTTGVRSDTFGFRCAG